jgi:hypothetical protein
LGQGSEKPKNAFVYFSVETNPVSGTTACGWDAGETDWATAIAATEAKNTLTLNERVIKCMGVCQSIIVMASATILNIPL